MRKSLRKGVKMNIGIDIDNTLTEIQDELNKAAYDYAIKLGKDIKDNSNSSEDAKNNGDSYKKKFQFNYEELKYFLKDIQEEITNNALPRKYVVEIIKKLRTEGHKIYIITARDSEFHDDPYLLSKNWLDKNNIEYDKLIVNARDKAPVCVEENIDIFIDDQLNNYLNVAKKGIQTIRISDDNKEYENTITLCDWKQIYDYIHNEKVIKIIGYDESYKEEIHNFINESMHKFIGRPYKERADVLDVNGYYIKNGGNFWLAIDAKSKRIIGSIAIENRNEYGILKRFYVEDTYQKLGIGKRLFQTLELYVKNNTNIKKVYLACGNTLKEAHKFYIKNGFSQIDKLDIEMYFAEDDNFFCKELKD